MDGIYFHYLAVVGIKKEMYTKRVSSLKESKSFKKNLKMILKKEETSVLVQA